MGVHGSSYLVDVHVNGYHTGFLWFNQRFARALADRVTTLLYAKDGVVTVVVEADGLPQAALETALLQAFGPRIRLDWLDRTHLEVVPLGLDDRVAAFEACIRAIRSGDSVDPVLDCFPAHSDELLDLVWLAGLLREVGSTFDPTPEAAARIRQRLMAQTASDGD